MIRPPSLRERRVRAGRRRTAAATVTSLLALVAALWVAQYSVPWAFVCAAVFVCAGVPAFFGLAGNTEPEEPR